MKTYLKGFLLWMGLFPLAVIIVTWPLLVAYITSNPWWLLCYIPEIVGILAIVTHGDDLV